MYVKKRYSVIEVFLWTRIESFCFIVYFSMLTAGYSLFEFRFLHIPWTPLAVLGTAVAFIVGFQNNSAYGRIWEARKIWGGIVNTSRTWGMKATAMIAPQHDATATAGQLHEIHRTLIHRHIAWMTALRYSMREPRSWEVNSEHLTNQEWQSKICTPEKHYAFEQELAKYLSKNETDIVLTKKSKSTAILNLQSKHIKELMEQNLLWDFSFLELQNVLEELFSLQGKSERIKNFPYPRQYATLSYYFVQLFILVLPFGMIPEFNNIGTVVAKSYPELETLFVWLAVPFGSMVCWVFHTMERIGRVGENPFEGSPNDVPISTIARGIEIDLRQMIEDTNIPDPFPQEHNVQM